MQNRLMPPVCMSSWRLWRKQEAEEQRIADKAELQAWAADAPAVLVAVLASNPALEDPIAKVQTMLSNLTASQTLPLAS